MCALHRRLCNNEIEASNDDVGSKRLIGEWQLTGIETSAPAFRR
jgi:hypothetical protein